MPNFQVLRHTFTKDEISIIKEAVTKTAGDKTTAEATRHHAAAILAKLNNVHRLSISYVAQEK